MKNFDEETSNLTFMKTRQNVSPLYWKSERKLGANCSRRQRNDTLCILHDIIQSTKSLKTPLSGIQSPETYLARNVMYDFWKSHQQHYFVMFSPKCRWPNQERFARKIASFPQLGELQPLVPPARTPMTKLGRYVILGSLPFSRHN